MATTVHKLIIQAESPMTVSQRKPGGIFLESFNHIPGSTLRGTTAARFLTGQTHRHIAEQHQEILADCTFCNLFLSETQAIFTDALPVADDNEVPQILPRTVVSCKSNAGFLSKDTHGAFDTLIDRYCWESLQPAAFVYAPTCKCGGRIDNFQGVYAVDDDKNYHKRTAAQRLLTRVAIDRRRNVAADGLLYSPWVLSEQQGYGSTETVPLRFRATIYGASEELIAALQEIDTIGGRGSRGLNHVRVKAEAGTPECAKAVQKRIDKFNVQLRERWATFAQFSGGAESQGTYFTVNLLSDAILTHRDGRPSMVLDAVMLCEAMKGDIAADRFRLVRSEAAYLYRGGWNSAWQRPKTTNLCIERGSVFLFQVADMLTAEELTALTDLQVRGVGSRTGEGYGQVRICDPFHLVTRENPV